VIGSQAGAASHWHSGIVLAKQPAEHLAGAFVNEVDLAKIPVAWDTTSGIAFHDRCQFDADPTRMAKRRLSGLARTGILRRDWGRTGRTALSTSINWPNGFSNRDLWRKRADEEGKPRLRRVEAATDWIDRMTDGQCDWEEKFCFVCKFVY